MVPAKLKNHDWIITICCGLLMILGLIVIYSSTLNAKTSSTGEGTFPKQSIFILIGLVIYFAISSVDISWVENKSIIKILYWFIILLLIYVKFFGRTIAGTNRWIDIGFFSLQPSEFGKIMIVILTASIFADYNDKRELFLNNFKVKKKKGFGQKRFGQKVFPIVNFLKKLINSEQMAYFKALGYNLIMISPIIILTLIQPSLGNAIISFAIWLITAITLLPEQKKFLVFLLLGIIVISFYLLLFNINIIDKNFVFNLRDNNYINYTLLITGAISAISLILIYKVKLIKLLMIFLLFSSIFWGFFLSWNNILTNYQKTRVETYFQGPESNPQGAGYQVIQSKIAIGSGMLTGRGFLLGTQSNLNVLTQAFTDFVFATFAEQFGFVGSMLILILYLIIILRIVRIAIESYNVFGKYLCIGISLIFLLHVFINIGMNLGLLPVTGIPLPLMSYGGSSIFMTMIALGLVQSVNSSKKAVDIADNLMLKSRSLIVKTYK